MLAGLPRPRLLAAAWCTAARPWVRALRAPRAPPARCAASGHAVLLGAAMAATALLVAGRSRCWRSRHIAGVGVAPKRHRGPRRDRAVAALPFVNSPRLGRRRLAGHLQPSTNAMASSRGSARRGDRRNPSWAWCLSWRACQGRLAALARWLRSPGRCCTGGAGAPLGTLELDVVEMPEPACSRRRPRSRSGVRRRAVVAARPGRSSGPCAGRGRCRRPSLPPSRRRARALPVLARCCPTALLRALSAPRRSKPCTGDDPCSPPPATAGMAAPRR